MILTLLVYGIYSELKNQTYDPDTDEAMSSLLRKAAVMVFFWPFVLIPLASKLKTERQQATWSLSVVLLTLLSFLGGIGLYLVVGIFLSAVIGLGYLYYVYKVHNEEKATSAFNEDWE